MKKLMMVAAIVCAAAFAQAATVDWNASGTFFDWNNFAALEGTITFFEASNLNSPLSNSPFSLDENGEFAGVVTGTDQTEWIARLTISNFDGGGSYYKDFAFYMDSITHAGSPDAATYLSGLSDTVSTAFDGIDLMATPASQGFTAAVPEPTSGLLLILGMAGLALRRKRA